MKYLIFLALLISIPLDAFAYSHNGGRGHDKEFLYTKDGCIRMNYVPEIKDSLIEKETVSLKLISNIVVELNSLAASIEATPKAQPNKQLIDDIAISLTKYINIQLDFRKNIKNKTCSSGQPKKRYCKNKRHAGKHRSGRSRVRDSIGLSIYTSTFELYNILEQPDTYLIHKREITSKYSTELEKLNRQLISSFKNYETAYYTSSNYKKEAEQYVIAIQQSLLFLSETYASEISKLDKPTLDITVTRRNIIINNILDNAKNNLKNLIEYLELKNNK